MDRPGAVVDAMPLHVSGGIPVQYYLNDLLQRLSNPGSEHALSEGSVPTELAPSNGSIELPSSELSGPRAPRDDFIDDLLDWFNRHQRVKINLPQHDQHVYVWQSFLEASSISEDNSAGIPVAAMGHDMLNSTGTTESSGNAVAEDPPAAVLDPQAGVHYQRYFIFFYI